MGIKVGAQMDPCPQPVMNFRWGNPDSFFDARTWNAIYFGLMINPEGKRFVREDLPFQGVSNAQNAQPGYGAGCFQVFDENMMEGMNDDATIQEFKDKAGCSRAPRPRSWARPLASTGTTSPPPSSATTAFSPAASTRTSTAIWRSPCRSRASASSR